MLEVCSLDVVDILSSLLLVSLCRLAVFACVRFVLLFRFAFLLFSGMTTECRKTIRFQHAAVFLDFGLLWCFSFLSVSCVVVHGRSSFVFVHSVFCGACLTLVLCF